MDYQAWTLMSPGDGVSPALQLQRGADRYLVLRYGNPRFAGYVGSRYKETGGPQVQFKDEDPAIRAHFEAELAKRGAASRMEGYTDEP